MPDESVADDIYGALSDDLRQDYWVQNANHLAGHCYVASETLFHLFPGKYKPMQVYVETPEHGRVSHWYLEDRETGTVVDLTEDQFSVPVPYHTGRGRGFMTKKPSKRTQIVLDRINGQA